MFSSFTGESGSNEKESVANVPELVIENDSYVPTPEAFAQTADALTAFKQEGDTYVSSDELDLKIEDQNSGSVEDTPQEKALNLDQMVAKFNGDAIPEEVVSEEIDPFEPMKKALEEEEKKQLLSHGVDIDENTPLVLDAEKEEHEEPVVSVEEPLPQSSFQERKISPSLQDAFPEERSQQPATFSLDQIVGMNTLDVVTPVAPSVNAPAPLLTTSFSLNSRMMVGVFVGLFVVGGLVAYLMFPGMFSSNSSAVIQPSQDHFISGENPTFTDPIDTDPVIIDPIDPEPEISACEEGEFCEEIGIWIPSVEEPNEPEDPNVAVPIIIEPGIIDPVVEEISYWEMMETLGSLSRQGNQYTIIGESVDDNYVVKYSSYVQYQSDFLLNQLES
ncbi:MAG: hypothetical protein LBI53_07390 [Candidatus Peribacteria bacterium]|nr:hypothetical protein [Candidatus Peribacteria bacterium]